MPEAGRDWQCVAEAGRDRHIVRDRYKRDRQIDLGRVTKRGKDRENYPET